MILALSQKKSFQIPNSAVDQQRDVVQIKHCFVRPLVMSVAKYHWKSKVKETCS